MTRNDLWRRLRGWFSPGHGPFRPEFGTHGWRAFDFQHPTAAQPAAIVDTLHAQLERRFVTDRDGLSALIGAIAHSCPESTRRTIAGVVDDFYQGLPIYGRRAPPLDGNFPWDHCAPGPGEDRLYAKRPHRFAFLPRVALAIALDPGRAGEFAVRLVAVLEGWQRSAGGVALALAFDSNLAVIQRLLNCTWAFMLLGCAGHNDAAIARARELIVTGVREDIRFLLPRLGSSAPNNHLLADEFAGWLIGALWPELAPAVDRRMRFEPRWLAEFDRQTLADGAGFEHSLHYHEYACEMATLYVVLSHRNGWRVPSTLESRLRAVLLFQSDLGGPEGSCFAFGDGIEDAMLPLGSESQASGTTWRVVSNALFDTQLRVDDIDVPAVVRACLLTGSGPPLGPGDPHPARMLTSYPLGGCHVFGNAAATTRLILRSGPARLTPIAVGHMHADWLSLYLVVEGTAAIVDAGTFTYRAGARTAEHPGVAWRRYFCGPSAHNGWQLRGTDPLGEMSGDFRTADCGARVRSDAAWIGGGLAAVQARWCSVDAYDGLCRTVCQVGQDYWIVIDDLPVGARSSEWEARLQFGSGWKAQNRTDQSLALHKQARRLNMTVADECAVLTVLEGSIDPPGGWIAPRYGAIEVAPQVRLEPLGEARSVAWALEPGRNAIGRLSVSYPRPGSVACRVETASYTDIIFVVTDNVTEVTSAWGIEFAGRLLHVRSDRDRLLSLGWNEGSYCAAPRLATTLRSPRPFADLRLEPVASEDGHTTNVHPAITIAFRGSYRLAIQE